MFYISAFCVFAVDLAIKSLIASRLLPAQSITLIKGILSITYVQNTGVAFGLFQGQRMPLIVIGLFVCFIVLYFFFKARKQDIFLIESYALILGGSLGNLFDRIFHGYVIDYIDIGAFPVFNLADIAINLGVFFILINLFFRGSECIQ